MTVEVLAIIAIVQLLILVGGLSYLMLHRRGHGRKGGDAHLEKLGEALMEKLESQSLTPEQKSKIAEALKELRERL